jgi:hypothetical protein
MTSKTLPLTTDQRGQPYDHQRWVRLRSELERLRPLLVAEPSIQQVYIFGSFAAQQTHA